MKKEITLLIMAAGMGSRYGGLKQIEALGPNGEFLIDYSIYDAVKEGFTKVVFVIKKENEAIFKETIGNRISKCIKVEYVFQEMHDLPKGYSLPEEREKPWGTAHAVYAARNAIHEPFAVINADDFYGRNAYKVVYEYLISEHEKNSYCVVGYYVKNALSENGAVKRAVCRSKDGILEELIESSVVKEDTIIKVTPLNGEPAFEVDENSLVCMNMLGFYPNLFTYIENKFPLFLEQHKEKPLTCEFFIPDIICGANRENYAKVEVVPTDAVWQGITYREDKKLVVVAIQKLIDIGEYPFNLWEE